MLATSNYYRYVRSFDVDINLEDGIEKLVKQLEEHQTLVDGNDQIDNYGIPSMVNFKFYRKNLSPVNPSSKTKLVCTVPVPIFPTSYGSINNPENARMFVGRGTKRVANYLKDNMKPDEFSSTLKESRREKLVYIATAIKNYVDGLSANVYDMKAAKEFIKPLSANDQEAGKSMRDVKGQIDLLEKYQKSPAERFDGSTENLVAEDGRLLDQKVRRSNGKLVEVMIDDIYNNPLGEAPQMQ